MFSFKNLKISTRLGTGFGLMIASLLGFSLYSIDNINRLAAFTEKLYQHPYTVSTAVLRVRLGITTMHRAMKEVVLSTTPEELQTAINEIDNQEKMVYDQFNLIKQRFLGDKKEIQEAEDIFKTWKPIRENVIRLKRDKKDKEAIDMTRDVGLNLIRRLQEQINDISNFAENRAKIFTEEAVAAKNSVLVLTTVILIILILLIAVFAISIIRSITIPLQETVHLQNQLAQGELDLTIPERSDDEIGQLLNSFENVVDSFKKTVLQVQQVARNVTDGSQNVSKSSLQMSSGVTEQATATQEVNVSVQNMTGGMRQTSEIASSTQAISAQVAEDAEATRQAMKLAVDAMTTITKQITFIEDIAVQTNMLALNASIEAVRSQEVNNGFSVVAVQIRKLANHTREAVLEINQLSHQSVSSVQTAGNMLEKLVPNIQQTAHLVKQMSQLNQQQLNSTNQIKQAIDQLDQVTEQNATMANDLSTMAANLLQQSEALQRSIAFFQTRHLNH